MIKIQYIVSFILSGCLPYLTVMPNNNNANYYTEDFYRAQKDSSYYSATQILPIIQDLIHPKHVIDVGCGVGTWLSYFKNTCGCNVVGLDGKYVDRKQLYIGEDEFIPTDLEIPISLSAANSCIGGEE